MDEFRLIARVRRILERGPKDPRVLVGIGDDAAVVSASAGNVVATTDSLVEGVHFRFAICRPRDVGYKAIAVNLSDLAAMGAKPLALLTSLCLPGSVPENAVMGLVRGFDEACRRYAVPVVGGNMSSTDGPLVVNVTALGEVAAGGCLKRDGARPGDDILVSGPLGSASLGLELLERHADRAAGFSGLVRAYRRPRPRLDIGEALVSSGGVSAAIDCSDGLLQDLSHILEASGVAAAIDVDAVPITGQARRFATLAGCDVLMAALTGGEDYEIIACANPALRPELERKDMVWIGRCTAGKGRLSLLSSGRRVPLPLEKGYRHGF